MQVATRIQLRRDTAANWTTTNPVLADGEVGLEKDTGKEKVGDGATAWASLGYRTAVASETHSATSKTTPVDADELPIADSAASFVLKKLTWANLKATLKTYFDALYQSSSGKDATGGYAGLTLFKINFKNAANTFTSFLTNANTAARTYTFQDRDGTIADNTDLSLKLDNTASQPAMRPSLLLNFSQVKALDPRITFSRASTASYYTPRGLLAYSAVDEPRFDHDPVTGQCKGLFIEEARTNLLPYSEQFDNAVWVKSNASIAPNASTAPDGTTTADKLVDSAVNTDHYANQIVTVVSGATYTLSVFVKSAERSQCALLLYGTSNIFKVIFNTSTGTFISSAGTGSYTTENVGNGWFRLSISAIATGASMYGFVFTSVTGTTLYTGDGTSGLYIWGAQLELGSDPSFYIPTTSAAATRSADLASMTGTNFSDWYRQDEGSFVCAFQLGAGQSAADSTARSVYAVSDGTANENIYLSRTASALTIQPTITDGGVSQAGDITATSVAAGSQIINSLGYKLNSISESVSGGAAKTDSSATLPTVDRIYFGVGVSGASNQLDGHIAYLAYYPKRVTNTELQNLSQQ